MTLSKNLYDKSITKVNSINIERSATSRLVTKTMYDSDKVDLEEKIDDLENR